MTDAPEVNFDAPVRKSPPVPTEPATPYAGLTRTACAAACNATGCAISGKGYCAHPFKGALHPSDMSSPAALARLDAARAELDRDGLEAAISKRKR